MMLKYIILLFTLAMQDAFASPLEEIGHETVYLFEELEFLTRYNYRSVLELGDVLESVEFQGEDQTFTTEETTMFDAVFIIDENDVVISGEWTHPYLLEDGSTVGALTLISLNSEGKHTRKIMSDHNSWNDPETGDEDPLDTTWFEPARRRALGDFIEFSVQYFYTPKAATFNGRTDVEQLKKLIYQSVGDTNIAYANSGLNLLNSVASIERWDDFYVPKLTTHRGHKDWYADFVDRFNAHVADGSMHRTGDIVMLIVGGDEGPAGYCGMARTVPGITDVHADDEDGSRTYSASLAFIIQQAGCMNDGRYVPAHEIGHLMGVGHNAHTDHCPPPYKGCGNILKCGDNGVRTIMSYTSKWMVDNGAAHDDFQCKHNPGVETTIPYFADSGILYRHGNAPYTMYTGTADSEAVSQIIKSLAHIPDYDGTPSVPDCATPGYEYWSPASAVVASPETSTSAADCQRRCRAKTGCVYFTWVPGRSSCNFLPAGAAFHSIDYTRRHNYVCGPAFCDGTGSEAGAVRLATEQWCTNQGDESDAKFSWDVGAHNIASCVSHVKASDSCGRFFNWKPASGKCTCVPKYQTCDDAGWNTGDHKQDVEVWERTDYTELASIHIDTFTTHTGNQDYTCGLLAEHMYSAPSSCNWIPRAGRRNLVDQAWGEGTIEMEMEVRDFWVAHDTLNHPDFLSIFLEENEVHPNVTIHSIRVPASDCDLGPEIDISECSYCGEVLSQRVLKPATGAGKCGEIQKHTCGHNDGRCDIQHQKHWKLYMTDVDCKPTHGGLHELSEMSKSVHGCKVFCGEHNSQFAAYHPESGECRCYDTCDNPVHLFGQSHTNMVFIDPAHPSSSAVEVSTTQAPSEQTTVAPTQTALQTHVYVSEKISSEMFFVGLGFLFFLCVTCGIFLVYINKMWVNVDKSPDRADLPNLDAEMGLPKGDTLKSLQKMYDNTSGASLNM